MTTQAEGTLPVLACACANLRRTARAVTRMYNQELRATGLARENEAAQDQRQCYRIPISGMEPQVRMASERVLLGPVTPGLHKM
jgi:hypothetical protein